MDDHNPVDLHKEEDKKEGSRDPSHLECLAVLTKDFLQKSKVQTAGFNAGKWTVWFRLEGNTRDPQKISRPTPPAVSPVGVIINK